MPHLLQLLENCDEIREIVVVNNESVEESEAGKGALQTVERVVLEVQPLNPDVVVKIGDLGNVVVVQPKSFKVDETLETCNSGITAIGKVELNAVLDGPAVLG